MENPVNPRMMRLARRIAGTMAFCPINLKLEYRRLLNGKLILCALGRGEKKPGGSRTSDCELSKPIRRPWHS
jgi:hypothetical protein